MKGKQKYREYKSIDYAGIAEEVLDNWKQDKTFEKSVSSRAGKPNFTFYEGPPSANGTPGIHHVMSRTVKDLFCRFKTMQGFKVERKGGWDTHGLPVEIQVEKQLGITKDDIGEKITVEEYNQKCREAVMKYKGEWDELTEKMGYWVDLDNPYITFKTPYMETLWHLLKQLYEKDLLYQGYTIQPYSPAAGTGLSSHELNQPGTYREIKDTSAVAQFKIVKNDHPAVSGLYENEDEEVFFLAWTTTPWTLPANSALAVGGKIRYVKIKTFNTYTHRLVSVILAKDLVPKYFDTKGEGLSLEQYAPGDSVIPYTVVSEFTGKEIVGLSYEQLLPYIPLPHPAFTVVPGDFVSTEEGTGIVHLAKTFGADDYRTCEQFGIPGIVVKDEEGKEMPIVDKKGKYVEEITDFAGMYVKNEFYPEGKAPEKSLDVQIAIKLKEENKAFRVEKYVHSYPHCWRTDKPVLYYPLESWFIKTTALKDRLVALNNTINWKPESTGAGRFGNWLENLVDWNLSRSRFWGTPLPVWTTEDKSEQKCIGSLEELEAEIEKSIAAGFMDASPIRQHGEPDLHRPYVDKVILVSDSGKKMIREKDLIDVWFDSGAMPYAQYHYPFENKEEFDRHFPADFIAEGVDQTRGWFFTLHAIAGLLYDSVAFKNVVSNGLVLDKNGNKMSKRKGNTVDPISTISKYGPDATRWYMIVNANPWDNLKFDESGIVEVQKRFFGTLHNTYSFFALYANIDNFKFQGAVIPVVDRPESDRWILSRLNSLIGEVKNHFQDYEPTRAGRAVQDFVIDDLSNWYVRLNRKRFWNSDSLSENDSKKAAYQTLYLCLETVAKLAAPIAPFYMDRLFSDLNLVTGRNKAESVHLTDFPEVNRDNIDAELEIQMEAAQKISSLVHSLRKKHQIKVRQPLSKILVPILNSEQKKHIQAVERIILSEVNIKAIEFVGDDSSILVKKIKPNFRKLGKVYGPKMKDITKSINQFSQEDINKLENEGEFIIELDGSRISLGREDAEISFEDIPGWSVASEGNFTVALDITITDELRKEGTARELVNRIQNLRKESGFEVQDKIKVEMVKASEDFNQAVKTHKDYICREVQAIELNLVEDIVGASTLDLDGKVISVKIERSKSTVSAE